MDIDIDAVGDSHLWKSSTACENLRAGLARWIEAEVAQDIC
jgi:hypothetical protein